MKKNIAVIFGGQSSEHTVSCMSAVNIIKNIDLEKYQVLLIGITEEGSWLRVDSAEDIESGGWRDSKVKAIFTPDAVDKCIYLLEDGQLTKAPIDLAFPILHGLYGEDGTIQGIFELARLPYVGCGVLSSAVSMDKMYTKIIVDRLGIKQAAYIPVLRHELKKMDSVAARVEEKFTYPVFIKPSNAGSSRGVSKACDREQLVAGLMEAARHDSKILVEETIAGHEIECAVFGGGNRKIEASGVGEILAAADFYDYDAKYNNEESRTVVNPVLPDGAAEQVRRAAVDIFKAVDGSGLARVDFFVTDAGEVIFNEINTMPGFTAISMYPMLWEEAGVNKRQLIDRLIQHGFIRYGE